MVGTLIVCADDYGAHPRTSAVIADLLAAGHLNAASCMTEAPDWPAAAARLRDLAGSAATGLHLALSDHPLDVVRASVIAPSRAGLEARVRRQLGLFTDAIGRLPHFVDGHHHVHLAPPVREALFAILAEAGFTGWLRQCRSGAGGPIGKRLFLEVLSGDFARRARAAGWSVNPGFGGLRRFSAGEDVAALWRRALRDMPGGGILMVHPGAGSDEIGACRAQEAALIGDGLVARLAAEAGLTLASDPIRPWDS